MVMVIGQIVSQAATGTVIGGVAGGGRRPGARPTDEEIVTGQPPRGNSGPTLPPITLPRTTDNVDTNRYQDNKKNDEDEGKCKLFPYKDRKSKCKKGNAHHAIPDHCWRMGNSVYLSLGRAAAKAVAGRLADGFLGDKVAQTFEESMSHDGKYYYPKMDRQEGLAICVEGSGKTLVHGAIHTLFDDAEKKLGETGNPKWTAKLGDLEDKAAEAMSAETGCSKEDLKKQLKEYHQGKNLGKDTLLRADPYGKNTTSMTDFKIDPIIQERMGNHSGPDF